MVIAALRVDWDNPDVDPIKQTPDKAHCMSTAEQLRKLRHLPEFTQLIHQRLRVCLGLSAIMIAYYSAFYLCMAFLPEFMARRLSSTGVMTIGVYFGISSMLLSVILAGYYTWWADRHDARKDKLIRSQRHEQGGI